MLLGQNPGPIARGRALTEQPLAPSVPDGLPSALLERRPDIQQAEQVMVAANARIGVAKAAYFPQISLTASGGVASTALSNLFTAGTWSVGRGPGAADLQRRPEPLAGRARRGAARRERARLSADDPAGVPGSLGRARRLPPAARAAANRKQSVVVAARDARRLADLRYQGGATSYLEVLDSDTRLFVAELGLVQAQLAEQSAFVEIYRALGGGWKS